MDPEPTPRPETPEEAAAALWRTRSRNRLANVDRLDALYHVYLAAIAGIAVVLFVSSALGDRPVGPEGLVDVRADGPAWVGLVVAVALAMGIRSGSRGGPLALEPAEVRVVLQAPVDRRVVLRRHALKLLRFGAFGGLVVGATAGELASHRLPGSALGWAAAGAAAAASTAVGAVALALVAGGIRLRRSVGTLVGTALVAWAGADAGWGVWSPARLWGGLATWPLEVRPSDLAAAALVLVAVVAGLRVLGGISMEAAERRTGLVAQLRFAVTVQDLRTVVLLRRQLAMDLPRSRPWVRLRKPARWFPVWRRDLRGLMRFPLARLLRLGALGAAAGLCLRGVWDGTTPLLVPAGLALYVAGLDAAEPMAQEADQLDRGDAYPVERGVLLLRHLAAPAVVMVLVGLVGWAAVAVTAPVATTLEVGAVALLPATLMAAAGAVVSVVMSIPSDDPAPAVDAQLVMPEMAGMKVAMRSGFPPLVAVAGGLPVWAAADAAGRGLSPAPAAATVAAVLVLPLGLIGAWVRFREPAWAWWRASLQQGQASRERTA